MTKAWHQQSEWIDLDWDRGFNYGFQALTQMYSTYTVLSNRRGKTY